MILKNKLPITNQVVLSRAEEISNQADLSLSLAKTYRYDETK